MEKSESPKIMGTSEDVLVKMILRPINPADISLVQGRMGRPSLPLIPGAEGEPGQERSQCQQHPNDSPSVSSNQENGYLYVLQELALFRHAEELSRG